jgi:hypothetical protein
MLATISGWSVAAGCAGRSGEHRSDRPPDRRGRIRFGVAGHYADLLLSFADLSIGAVVTGNSDATATLLTPLMGPGDGL